MKLLEAPRRVCRGARIVHESAGTLFLLAMLTLAALVVAAFLFRDWGVAFTGSGLLLVVLVLCYVEGRPEEVEQPPAPSAADYERLAQDKLGSRRHELAKDKSFGLYREDRDP